MRRYEVWLPSGGLAYVGPLSDEDVLLNQANGFILLEILSDGTRRPLPFPRRGASA